MQAEETQSLKPTRASFVRSLPEAMPVQEVIERGREVGLTIQPSDVHSIRYYMRQEADAMASAVPASLSRMPPPVRLQPAVAAPAPEVRESRKLGQVDHVGKAGQVGQVDKADKPEPKQTSSGQRGRKRVGRVAREVAPAPPGASWEDQLRVMVVRMGSDRVREAVTKIEDEIARKASR